MPMTDQRAPAAVDPADPEIVRHATALVQRMIHLRLTGLSLVLDCRVAPRDGGRFGRVEAVLIVEMDTVPDGGM